MTDPPNPQLPPKGEIRETSLVANQSWFEYPVRAYPHHTDYAGIVWHGAYLTWMEEARVECLRSLGIEFANLVAIGCDLPVVELSVRYHRSMTMGMTAIVKTRLEETSGVRLNWPYQIVSVDGRDLFVSATVTLVAVDSEKGKIMRQLPPAMRDALVKLSRD